MSDPSGQSDSIVRAFIAVRVPATPAIKAWHERLSEAGRAIRPVASENLHLTLRFLGGTFASLLPNVGQAVTHCVDGIGPFDVRLVGLGAFPSVQRPRVLWVGTRDDAPLYTIVQRLEPRLNELGFGSEDRPWSSHITLARVKARPPSDLREAIQRNDATEFGTLHVRQIDVMLSTRTDAGAMYRVDQSIPLKPK